MITRSIAAIRPKDGLNLDFLYYYFLGQYELYNKSSEGAAQPILNKTILSSFDFPLPPIDEQERIVSKLDECFESIDKARANVEKNLQNAKDLFQSQLNQIFSQKGDGWEYKKLEDLCEIIGGGTPSKKVDEYFNGDIPWATVRDMNVDILDKTEVWITKDGLSNSSAKIITEGNVIIATRVGLGKVCILNMDTAINQDLKGIVPKKNIRLDSNYLFWWFKSISKQIIDAGTGATVQGVKLPFIQLLSFPYTALSEQEDIVSKLDTANEHSKSLKLNCQQELDALDELKKSILQKAFNGEL